MAFNGYPFSHNNNNKSSYLNCGRWENVCFDGEFSVVEKVCDVQLRRGLQADGARAIDRQFEWQTWRIKVTNQVLG